MDKPLIELYQSIQKLIGLHRQLLDLVRVEREALTHADLKGIQDATQVKQGLIESIERAETERMKYVSALAVAWKKPIKSLTLSQIAIITQGDDLKSADQLRSALTALTMLAQRIAEQNEYNRALLERSLSHIERMKRNVLGEGAPKSGTYSQKGQKVTGGKSSRLISKEA